MVVVLTKTPEALRNDIESFVLPNLNSSGNPSGTGALKSVAERVAAGAAVSGINQLVNPGSDRDTRTINHFYLKTFQYGFNFHNKWKIELSNNLLSINELNLMQSYVSEFSEPTFDFTETNAHLGFRKHKDISNIEQKEFSLSFYVDDKMIIKTVIAKLLNKMKNFTTGKLGYKDDFKFDNIFVRLYDGIGNEVFRYQFDEVVMKGFSDKIHNNESATLQNVSITFEYDNMTLFAVQNGFLAEIF